MLPTAATALSAAQLAHVFENGAILSSLQAVCELQGSTHFYAFIFMPVPAAPRQRPGNVTAMSRSVAAAPRQNLGSIPATSQQRPSSVPTRTNAQAATVSHRALSFNGFFVRFFVRMRFLVENVCTRLCHGWHHQSPPKFHTKILWWHPAPRAVSSSLSTFALKAQRGSKYHATRPLFAL